MLRGDTGFIGFNGESGLAGLSGSVMELSIFWSLVHPESKFVITTDRKKANLNFLDFILFNRSDEFFRFSFKISVYFQ